MTVKPAVFALLAVAGLGAAGVGGYLAVSSAVPPAPTTVAQTAPSPSPAVSETEAIVADEPAAAPASSERATPPPAAAPSAEAEPVEAPRRTAPAPVRREAPRTASARPAPAATTPSAPTRPAPESRPATPPAPPVVARDEAPRPSPEPVRDAPVAVEAPRDPARAADERAVADAPAPRAEEYVVPADSVIGLRLEDTITSETARLEQRVDARVTRDVRVGGTTVIPAGTRARGEVTLVEGGGRFKERARLGIRFHTLVLADGTSVPIETETLYREGDEVGKKAATRIGASAVGGAIVGAIFGGGRGAAIGAAAGAGAGTAATAASQRSTATLPSGTTVTVRLTGPTTVMLEP